MDGQLRAFFEADYGRISGEINLRLNRTDYTLRLDRRLPEQGW
jgi:hypothetical protein